MTHATPKQQRRLRRDGRSSSQPYISSSAMSEQRVLIVKPMTARPARRSGRPKASAASPECRLEVTVDRNDVDGLGHVNNIVYVRWLQDVAMAHAFAVWLSHA